MCSLDIKPSSYAVAPSYQRKLIDPNWDYNRLPLIGECWMIRSPHFQNPPVIAFHLRNMVEEIPLVTQMNITRTTPSLEFAATQLADKSGMFIKKKGTETFHSSTIRDRVINGARRCKESNGVDVCPFELITISESYLINQIKNKMAIKLNDSISEIWKLHYVKFKFVSGVEGSATGNIVIGEEPELFFNTNDKMPSYYELLHDDVMNKKIKIPAMETNSMGFTLD